MFQTTTPNAPALETLVSIFKDNPVAGCLSIAAFLLCFLVIVKFGDILSFMKDRASKKEELETKKIDLDQRKHDETITALGNMTKVVENNTQAINSVEKTILLSESKTTEKFSALSKDMVSMEARLTERISSSAKDVGRDSKMDKIAAALNNRASRSDADERYAPEEDSDACIRYGDCSK